MSLDFTMLPSNLDEDPEHVELELEHFGLLACAYAYSSRNGTDGFVPDRSVRGFGKSGKGPKVAGALVEAGMLERVEGGYVVRRYLDTNPTRAKVDAKREAGRERKRAYDERTRFGFDGALLAPQGNGARNALPEALRNAARTPSVTALEKRREEERREDPPMAPRGGPVSTKSKRGRATSRIPDDWQPTAATLEVFRSRGFDAAPMVEEFRDYWLGRGTARADWDATFRSRVTEQSNAGKVPIYRAPVRPIQLAEEHPDDPSSPPVSGAELDVMLAKLPAPRSA